MANIVRNFGTVGGFSLDLAREKLTPGPGETTAMAASVLVLTLTQGAIVRQVGSYVDGAYDKAGAAGQAIIAAIAALGGSVVLGGDPATPTPAGGTADARSYSKSVTLVPGTPVPAGRGVVVKSPGSVVAKLQNGGTIRLLDVTGGFGTQFDGVAVVDIDTSQSTASSVVQVLY